MPHPEEDYEIHCPYCGTGFTVRVDSTAGDRQSLVVDCENCCRPIEVEVDIDPDGSANIAAKREGEG